MFTKFQSVSATKKSFPINNFIKVNRLRGINREIGASDTVNETILGGEKNSIFYNYCFQ